MGRSGYSEDGDYDNPFTLLWPSIVKRSIKGARGQNFLKALAKEMDKMPEKKLIKGELVTEEGACCAMGVICKARGIDVADVDYNDCEEVAELLGISPAMAGDIAYHNDDEFGWETQGKETDEQRWVRMRKWVQDSLEA